MQSDENITIRSISINPGQKESQYIGPDTDTRESLNLSNREHLIAIEQANRFGADFEVPISEKTAKLILEQEDNYSDLGALSIATQQVNNLPSIYSLYASQNVLRYLVGVFGAEQEKFQLAVPNSSESTNEGYLTFLLTTKKDSFWEDFSKLYGPCSEDFSFAARFLIGKATNIADQDKYNHSVVIHEATHATEFDIDGIVKESDDLRKKALVKLIVSNNENLAKEGTNENPIYKKFMNDIFKMNIAGEARAIFNELSYDTEGTDKGFSSSRCALRLLHLLGSFKTSSHGGFCEFESSLRNLYKGNLFVMTGSIPHQIAIAMLVLGEDSFDIESGLPNVDRILAGNKTGDFDIDAALVTAEIANKVMIATAQISEGKQPFSLTDSFYTKLDQSLLHRAENLAQSSNEMIDVLSN